MVVGFYRVRLPHQYFNRCKDVTVQGRPRQPCKDFPGLAQMPPCLLAATWYLLPPTLLPATHFHVMAFIATSINMDLLVRTSPSSHLHSYLIPLRQGFLELTFVQRTGWTIFPSHFLLKTRFRWVLLQGPSHS